MTRSLIRIAFSMAVATVHPCVADEYNAKQFPPINESIVTNSRLVGCFSSEEVAIADEYYSTHVNADDFMHVFWCEVIPANTKLYVTNVRRNVLEVSRSSSSDFFGIWILNDRRRWRVL